MIFVTTGHQTPFDRLIRLMDLWAAENPHKQVFAQIGAGTEIPQNLRWCRWLTPIEFEAKLAEASLVVGHAGTGTILQTLQAGKPILVLARRSCLGETRNDHQIATVREFVGSGTIHGAVDEQEFVSLLDHHGGLVANATVNKFASKALLSRIRNFLEAG